jgi:Tol biopolymer transport system component
MSRLATTLLALVAAVSSGGAAATPTPSLPLLTFAAAPSYHRDAPFYGGLCTTDLHGHPFRITDPGFGAGAAWSPNGDSIAFLQAGTLIVTDAQGRNAREVAGNSLGWLAFDWSPDGSKLAVSSNQARFGAGSLGIVNADGTGGRLLVPSVGGGVYIGAPSWSPDGTRILYSTSNGPTIYVVNADGGNPRPLLDSGDEAVWSPDGRRLAYVAFGNGQFEGIGVADADGGNAHVVAHGRMYWPVWSPDSRQLAYLVSATGGNPFDLGVVDADGSDARVLTEGIVYNRPAWSPDGSMIALAHGPVEAPRLALVRPDGTGEQRVPTSGLAADEPAWRVPAPLPSHRRRCIVRGTARADVIHGTDLGDLIDGGAGNDRIYGGGADDVLLAGGGRDRIFGGDGSDTLVGGNGRDRIYGGDGNDTLVGGNGSDRLYGGWGDDVFRAKDGQPDLVFGGPGRDKGYFDPRLDRISSVKVRHYGRG